VLSWMRWNFTPPETNFPHMEWCSAVENICQNLTTAALEYELQSSKTKVLPTFVNWDGNGIHVCAAAWILQHLDFVIRGCIQDCISWAFKDGSFRWALLWWFLFFQVLDEEDFALV
jgi:hypothetical protein